MDIDDVCRNVGKLPSLVHYVYADGSDFAISAAAEELAKELGYKVGIMCGEEPRALSKKATYIAKWWNIGREDFPKMEGVMLCDDPRNGTVAAIVEFVKGA